MSDSSSSTPSAPAAPSAPSTLGTNAAGQAQSAQAHAAQAKSAPKAPNSPTTPQTAPKAAADAKAVINDPNAPKAAKQEAKKTLKQLSYKLDGKDFTEDLPFEIPDDPKAIEYMRRELQMSKMGQKRAQYASELEKDVQKFIQDVKADPFKVLQDPNIGVDIKDAIKKYIETEIENSQKSPEQLALEAAKNELKALKEQQENDKKTRDEQEKQTLADKYEREFDDQITQALNSSKIPRSPAAVKKILDYAQLAVNANKDVSINDIIPFVAEELRNDYLEHVNALPDEALEEFFGKNIVDRLRKTAVKRVKTAAGQNPALKAPTKAPSTGKAAESPQPEQKKISYNQFFKLNGR